MHHDTTHNTARRSTPEADVGAADHTVAMNDDEKRYHLLVVDDEPNIRKSLKRLFMELEDTDVFVAADAHEAMEILRTHTVDLMVADEKMPGIQGHELAEYVKTHYPYVLRIMLTGYSDMEAMRRAVNRGEVYRYLSKPWNDDELIVIAKNALNHSVAHRERDELNERLMELVEERTKQLKKALAIIKKRQAETEEALSGTLSFLDSVISMIKRETGGQTPGKEITRLSRRIAQGAGLDATALRLSEMAGFFLPIGALMLGMEWEHTVDDSGTIRADVLETGAHLFNRTLRYPELAEAIHHMGENWDGSGHPDGLSGDRISVVSRVLRIALDYHVHTSISGMSPSQAVRRIQSASGSWYDPQLVQVAAQLLADPVKEKTHHVKIGSLVAGMVLAQDLTLDNGMTYIAAETTLSPEMVESVRTRALAAHFPLSAEREAVVRVSDETASGGASGRIG